MNKNQIKKALTEKARELAGTRPSKEDIAIEPTAELLDEIQHTGNREIALEIMSRNWMVATDVQQALQRLEDGTYGICQECEEEISARRLAVVPWAKYCIQCQQAADEMKQGVGTPLAA